MLNIQIIVSKEIYDMNYANRQVILFLCCINIAYLNTS